MSARKILLLSILLLSCASISCMQEETTPPAPPTIDLIFLEELKTAAHLSLQSNVTANKKSETTVWMLRLHDFYTKFEEPGKKRLLKIEHKMFNVFSYDQRQFIDARYQESQFLAHFFAQDATRITEAFNRFVSPETESYFTQIFHPNHNPEQIAQEMHNLNVELLQEHVSPQNEDLSNKAVFGVAVHEWTKNIGNNLALREMYEDIALRSALAECVRRDYEKQCEKPKPSGIAKAAGALMDLFGKK